MRTKGWLLIALAMLGACSERAGNELIIIDLKKKGAPIASSMYGIFFEEINNAGDGGLYAELVMNRSFEGLEMPEGYKAEGDQLIPRQVKNHQTGHVDKQTFKWTTEAVPGWSLETAQSLATMKLTKERCKFPAAPNNLKVQIKSLKDNVFLINRGYWGMNLIGGDNYLLRTIIRPSDDYKGSISLMLLSEKGELLAKTELNGLRSNEWNDVETTLVPSGSDARARLSIEFNSTGTVWLDYVSLFPEKTFHNRPNGLRIDIAGMLQGLKPSFVRWPGGCVVEGISLDNAFEWKKTLGDPAARPGEYSLWGYRNTYGFGYHEFLQFCEDLGADAMYVCNVGIGCQYRMGDACKDKEVGHYLNDCLDAIEYAIGGEETIWGAKRAADGHPAPFPLKYVEIGNENRGELYDQRFDIFYAAIKEKYPQLVLISNHGINGTGKIKTTDMVDPHWYVSPDFFFGNTKIFDSLERGKYTVYVGEYAVNSGVGNGNMMAALSEAAFITGMERNGDLVIMASYAPLLENRNNRCWPVNLIWLDTDKVLGRSSYYVQKMTANHKPDFNLALNKTMAESKPANIPAGAIGFGTWATKAEFKEIRVTSAKKHFKLDANNCATKRGNWLYRDGVLSQTSMEQATRYIVDGFAGDDFVLEFKGRKIEGKEGFFVHFASRNNHSDGFAFNLGGWDNTTTAVQNVVSASTASQLGPTVSQTLERGRWYHVKLIVSPEKAELYVDGAFILGYRHNSTPLQFYAAGYDAANEEVILKVVNADSISYSAQIVLDNAFRVDKTGKIITLKAKSGLDENSFEEPEKIYPHEFMYKNFGKKFNYQFLPYSYTIMRMKAQVRK